MVMVESISNNVAITVTKKDTNPTMSSIGNSFNFCSGLYLLTRNIRLVVLYLGLGAPHAGQRFALIAVYPQFSHSIPPQCRHLIQPSKKPIFLPQAAHLFAIALTPNYYIV